MSVLRSLVLAWTIMLCFVAAVALAQVQARPHVLLLNSYHQGFRWTDEVVQAVRGTLASASPVEIHVEYMDAKRIESPDYLDQYADLLRRKYTGLRLSVVATSDDPAFDFVLRHRGLFGDAPVVFCGTNDITPDRLRGKRSGRGDGDGGLRRGTCPRLASASGGAADSCGGGRHLHGTPRTGTP